MDKYRIQRRLIGPVYAVSSIKDVEPALDSILTEIVASMDRWAGKTVDLDTWSHMLAIGENLWGLHDLVAQLLTRI